MTIPDGLEPIATWGPHAPGWADANVNEKIAWAEQHIDRARDALRAEFYALDDGPVARVRYYARNADGRKHHDPVTRQPALEPERVIVPLSELPPAHLLGR